MDLRRLRAGEWIAAISGVVLLVSLFLPWSEASGAEINGWEAFSATDVFLAALAIAALAAWVVVATAGSTGPGISLQTLLLPFALVMAIVCVLGISGDDEPGAWIGLVATLGVLAGLLIGMRDERLSKPGRPTDATGVPAEPPVIETLPGPPAA